MGYENEVRERIYLTSDKRAVVPESDRRARFLLATPGPISPVKAKEIKGYKQGGDFLHKISAGKATKPSADKALAPGDDKSGTSDADKDKVPSGTALGPDDAVTFGKHEGTLVRELPDAYLKNLARVSPDHRATAEAEIARRTEEAD